MLLAPIALASQPLPAARPFVLLVDDHEPSLCGLCEALQLAGLRCVAARSPGEALIYCDTRRPAAVVTDFSMPMIDGAVFARWLAARYPGVPIVLVTGHDPEDPAFLALRTTFAAVLSKPVDPGRLLDLLADLMPRAPGRVQE